MRHKGLRSCFTLALATALCLLWAAGCTLRGPTAVGSDPGPGASGLKADAGVLLTFDRPMDAASLQLAANLKPESGRLVITISADDTQAFFQPERPLLPNTEYTLGLGREARDTGGARLRRQFNLRFRTSAGREATCSFPVWSADGTRLAWLEDSGGDWSLWVAEVAGPGEDQGPSGFPSEGIARTGTPVKLAGNLWPGSRAVFSPDGGRLLVVIPQTRGSALVPGLAYVDAGGGVPRPLALNEQLEDPSRLVASFSPDGTLLAVQNDMYMADAHSDYLRQLGVARSDGSGFTAFGNLLVGWGTGGSWLIYLDMPGIGEAHNFNYDVWRYDPAAGVKSMVPGAPKINNFGVAARSPDGLYFVFSDWQAEDVPGPQGPQIEHLPRDLWRLSADGKTALRLTAGAGHNAEPTVSEDGKVAFASDRVPAAGDWDVWLLGTADPGSTATNLTARPGYDGQPAFRPGGNLIAYVSDASGNREVWLMAPDGSGRKLISLH